MLRDTYQGGTVAAATPLARRSDAKAAQRVGLFRWNALSSTRWQTYAVFPPDIRAFGDYSPLSSEKPIHQRLSNYKMKY
jgi:hypothetical protein